MSSFEDPDDGRNQDQHSINSQQVERVHSPTNATTKNQSMAVGELMEAYEVCTSSLRKSQGSRRSMSLKRIAPANFSKEARLLVPEKVLQEILSLNNLDVELYKHAQDIFLQQQKHLMQKDKETLKQQHSHLSGVERQGSGISLQGSTHWKGFSLFISAFLFIVVIFLIVTSRRRTFKLKV